MLILADMTAIALVTASETTYVDEQGRFVRPGKCGPSDTWTMLGAVEYGRGYTAGRIVRCYSLDDARAGRVPWFYRNGKQRCYVVDLDRGTRRALDDVRGHLRLACERLEVRL